VAALTRASSVVRGNEFVRLGVPELCVAPAQSGSEFVSSLLDQVEAKVAGAKRAFRRSRNIIAAARDDLESHQRWLERHRAAWAQDVKRDQRLLNRKLTIWAFKRFSLSLILVVPFVCIALFRRISALARAFRLTLKERPSHASSQLSFAETARDNTRQPQLQHRIRGLDGQLCTMQPAVLRPTAGRIEMRGDCSPILVGAAFRAVASLGSFSKGTVLVSTLGVITVFLIAAGAVRATISSLPAEAPVLAAPKMPGPPQRAAAVSVTVPKAPGKAQRSAPSPVPISGFAVLAATSASEPLLLPAQTIADMMLITSPLALVPMEPETTTAPVAGESLAVKPKVKAKLKRKLARQEPQQQLPWWRQLPWIRVR
jgi:hypothetical protein